MKEVLAQTTEDLSFEGIEVDTMRVWRWNRKSVVVVIVDNGQHSVDPFADAADLPLEGIKVTSTWLDDSYIVGISWGVEGVRRRGEWWRG